MYVSVVFVYLSFCATQNNGRVVLRAHRADVTWHEPDVEPRWFRREEKCISSFGMEFSRVDFCQLFQLFKH